MRIVFFNRFFYPDTSATSQIVSDLAFHLAAQGDEVHAVTSFNAPDQALMEVVGGVHIHRVAPAATGPHTLLQRARAYLAYFRGARKLARRLIAAGDVAIVMTDPPMLSAAVGSIVRARGGKLVVWLQDVFPEIAREYGIAGMRGPLGSLVMARRNKSLALADRVVAIGDRMADRVAPLLVSRDRLAVIHNWADGDAIRPIDNARNPLRESWSLERMFVVGYSGNLGRVHEFDTLVDAANILRDERDVRFLVIGRGPRLAYVKQRVSSAGLTNFVFQDHQRRESLGESLAASDVHISVLQPRFEGLVHPSKLYGIMAAGRPTIFIGDIKGETASILEQCKCGLSVAAGDAQALSRAILSLRDDAALRACMGGSARAGFDRLYTRHAAFSRWTDLVSALRR
jgi:colanic acid biosynthesis glycosyl transferase WcaI